METRRRSKVPSRRKTKSHPYHKGGEWGPNLGVTDHLVCVCVMISTNMYANMKPYTSNSNQN